MGIIHKADPGWASFIPVLIKAIELTDGPVMELGAGMFSTPLLHALCRDRSLLTLENDPRFIEMFKRFRAPFHVIHQVEHWKYLDRHMGAYESVVFVDQKPAEARAPSIRQLTQAEYVVIHDSNDPIYDYESIYPLFKYRFTHEYLQHTTVLSNKHDVQDFLHNSVN